MKYYLRQVKNINPVTNQPEDDGNLFHVICGEDESIQMFDGQDGNLIHSVVHASLEAVESLGPNYRFNPNVPTGFDGPSPIYQRVQAATDNLPDVIEFEV